KFVGLLAEFLRRSGRLAVDYHVAVNASYITPVVVSDGIRINIVSKLAGDRTPRRRRPYGASAPPRRGPSALMFTVPLLAVHARMVNVVPHRGISGRGAGGARILRRVAVGNCCACRCALGTRVLRIVAI